MSEMNEKVEEPQEQAADRPTLREIFPEELEIILEAHRMWVESEVKEGERADLHEANLEKAYLNRANLQKANLGRANLQRADLRGANLQRADLRDGRDLTASQIKAAYNWKLAFYSGDFLKKLRLPPDHNERVRKKLAELEKEKKETGAKP